jgi:AraC-like DNA-binding protein
MRHYHHYTPEELQFLKDNNEGCSRGELAAKFNRHFGLSLSRGCISCKVRDSGLLAPSNIPYHHHYTPEELQFLKDNNEGCSRGELAAKFNQHFGLSLTTDAIKGALRFYKIEKKAVYIGTETICKSGYISKKIASGKWRYKHILIWEAANGPVPPGHVVLFLDGDKTNFNLDNLYLLPKRLLGSINRKGLIFRSKDLTTQGIALAQLELLVSDMAGASRKKKRAEDEQG